MVESKLRQVVMRLETIDNIELAHPYIKSFDKKYICRSDEERNDCIHGKFPVSSPPVPGSADQPATTDTDRSTTTTTDEGDDKTEEKKDGNGDGDIAESISTVYTTSFYIGLKTKTPTVGTTAAAASNKLDISWPVSQFTDLVHRWELYDATAMGMAVNLIKR